MRVIVSGDFQTNYGNLHLCHKVWKHLIQLARKEKLEAIVLTGDLKDNYDPVGIRIVKFWQRAIEKARRKGIRVIILLGNHDREGLYTDANNWLSILRRAGAETYDKPGVCELKDGKMAMLPYSSSVKRLREWAKRFSEMKWDKRKDILLFHADVKGCQYNALGWNDGARSKAKLQASDLFPRKYNYCVGGHIHHPQILGENIYYVGSPFAMDWGEGNSRKRFLVIKDGGQGWDVAHHYWSPIPNWYDPTWPGFNKKGVTKGSRIRIHVEVQRKQNYNRVIDKARKRAEKQYPGCIIKIQPSFAEADEWNVKINENDPDKKKIETYISETVPRKLRKRKKQIRQFLINRLKRVGGIRRSGTSCRFISAEGKNVLSFKKIKIDYRKRGLLIVEGKNKDWNNQSNGAGKTAYTQLLPISLFGETFKKQKADRWARRNTKQRATISIKFEIPTGRVLTVVRGRRPTKLQLLEGKRDLSYGMNKGKKDGTQAYIESLTGLTWDTLANSVYIDKTIAHAFLSRKVSERTELLRQFQNLERFDRALELVKDYRKKHSQAMEQVIGAIDILGTQAKDLSEHLSGIKTEAANEIRKLIRDGSRKYEEWKRLNKKRKKLSRFARITRKRFESKYEATSRECAKVEKKIELATRVIWEAEQIIQKHGNIFGNCPTCGAKIDEKIHRAKVKKAQLALKEAEERLQKRKEEKRQLDNRCITYESNIDAADVKVAEIRGKAETAKIQYSWIKEQIGKLSKSEHTKIGSYRKKLRKLKAELKDYKRYVRQLEKDEIFIQYCEESFSRKGIPAFLNQQLAPILNRAAEEYSDLFTDKEIMVRHEIEDGNIVPKVLNAHGGDSLDDQSTGEAAMAGIIESFALKEIVPKTNVLILDEPADGLSAENIKRFAKGLLSIRKKFETIMLVTHNPLLLSELNTCKRIRIIKRNGISVAKNR